MWIFPRDRRLSTPAGTRNHRRIELGAEEMEGRRLLSGSGALIVLSGSTVEVVGTNLGDTGLVTQKNGSVEVQVSNSQGSDDVLFPASAVSAIDYFGGSGSNTFTNATSLTGYLFGGSGNNVLNGGSGMDYLFASSGGQNVLDAGSGSEYLFAFGSGTNSLNGGSGYDTIYTFSGVNHVVGGTGSSFIIAVGGQNTIDGGPGNSIIYSFSSNDVIVPNKNETVVHIGY